MIVLKKNKLLGATLGIFLFVFAFMLISNYTNSQENSINVLSLMVQQKLKLI